MSSGFVSGGTIDNPTERDDAWLKAQAELEESRRKKETEAQNDGKSLYEVLQANKDAKQAAFEEANRLKNQFRALDDDEAEFLDSILEQTRKKEAEVRKDTLEQLDVFRRQKEEAERKALEEANTDAPVVENNQWAAVGRKRKKGNEKDGDLLKGVKLRKVSSTADTGSEAKKAVPAEVVKVEASANVETPGQETRKGTNKSGKYSPTSGKITAAPTKATTSASPPPKPVANLSLSLGYASSDDDD